MRIKLHLAADTVRGVRKTHEKCQRFIVFTILGLEGTSSREQIVKSLKTHRTVLNSNIMRFVVR